MTTPLSPENLTLIAPRKSAGGRDIVSARALHQFLEVATRYNDWFRRRVEEYRFVENRDYSKLSTDNQEVVITLDMAKELAMVERNEQGQRARHYFIACEKQLRSALASPALPSTYADALRQLADSVEARQRSEQALQLQVQATTQARHELQTVQQVVEAQQPAVELVAAVFAAGDLLDLETVAKTLALPGLGRTNLVKRLVDEKVLTKDSKLPYQPLVNQGYFQVRHKTHTDAGGRTHATAQVMVTMRGLDFLRRRLGR
ncbi:antA/AntB antirepressor family protein [Hymenobacter sp.]|uniref:antA/AntB antirepressor family protein n=1 Tax=Hymenobacter sp. TaxID=1898978 RepID=UPI00286BE205|nr:antA/AntB antirepressor family protein [Hymenobacter sp.]